jgi:hypothetical protein
MKKGGSTGEHGDHGEGKKKTSVSVLFRSKTL